MYRAHRGVGHANAAPRRHSVGLALRSSADVHIWRGGRRAASAAVVKAVITDAAVPEGHASLHNELYAGSAEAVHAAGDRYDFRKGEDDGSAILAVCEYLTSRDGEKPLGVYSLYDDARNLQYVGYSRNIVVAVKGHLKRVGEQRCAWIRPMVVANRSMATREVLDQQVAAWLAEAGTTPVGNGAERLLWEGVAAPSSGVTLDTSAMSEQELNEYQDKKLKMQLAMGENLYDAPPEDPEQRRSNTIKALQLGDWSAVVDRQTQATVSPSEAPTGPSAAGDKPMVSPFSRATVHRTIGDSQAGAGARPMSIESVDAALEEVRPYLQADGGEVTVVDVSSGRVFLRLEGACGTCAQSTSTMSMGIERQLRAVFGDDLKEVVQVDKLDAVSATIEGVDRHLDMFRGAVAGLGGRVTVVSVEGSKAVLQWSGPKPLGEGVKAAIKDKFPTITTVILEPFPSQ